MTLPTSTPNRTFVATTADLRRLAERAIIRRSNRQLDPAALDRLADDGLHVLTPMMELQEPTSGRTIRWRCLVLMKFTDEAEPVMGSLDVTASDMRRLPDTAVLLELS